jgi:hypothetical protein
MTSATSRVLVIAAIVCGAAIGRAGDGAGDDASTAANAALANLKAQFVALRALHADEPEVVAKLDAAEQSFAAFRTAHVDALLAIHDGSAAPICAALSVDTLASTYAKILGPVEEGDVCAWQTRPAAAK